MKIVIDGPIGAGKSTQVDIISKLTGQGVVKEPIDEWPLELFYEDSRRWGFLMQVAVLNSYVNLQHKEGIFERCPESTRAVFWKNLVNTDVVAKVENDVFQQIFEKLTWEPDVIIFIDKSPELCHEHIQTRNQTGDDGVSMQYLRDLHKLYIAHVNANKHIHVVDGNRPVESVTQDILKIINPIMSKSACQGSANT